MAVNSAFKTWFKKRNDFRITFHIASRNFRK